MSLLRSGIGFLALSYLLGLLSGAVAAQDLSVHVPTKDGTQLAVDVYLPAGHQAGDRYPALLELTRYWRAQEDALTGKPRASLRGVCRHLLAADYALVKVDVRGTGASFGTRTSEYGRQEVRDGYDIVEWVVSQAWCTGVVGAYGTSYTGTTAEFLAACGHPAVKAVIPGWSDFDAYRSPVRPYGMYPAGLMDAWGRMVRFMDVNDAQALGGSVRRVQADTEGHLLAEALAQHEDNFDVTSSVRGGEYRDSSFGSDTYAEISSLYWKQAIEKSGVPMLVFASWLDAGTADGALQRLQHYSNPQKVLILASSHGGSSHASPFEVGGRPGAPRPSTREQFEMRRAFFDRHLKGIENDVDEWPTLRFYNMGEESYHDSDAWPLEGVRPVRLFPGSEGSLGLVPEGSGERSDVHEVDYGVTIGIANRWSTQLGGPVLRLDDRGAMNERMLTYTSDSLEDELQVTGTPVVHLRVRTNRKDLALFCYLEDVDPEGRVRYVTEGGLRLVHRKLGKNPVLDETLPYHSFNAADARPLVPGEITEVTFRLWSSSVLFQEGHRIQISIAGADAGNFERIPAQGETTLELFWGAEGGSYIELPILD